MSGGVPGSHLYRTRRYGRYGQTHPAGPPVAQVPPGPWRPSDVSRHRHWARVGTWSLAFAVALSVAGVALSGWLSGQF